MYNIGIGQYLLLSTFFSFSSFNYWYNFTLNIFPKYIQLSHALWTLASIVLHLSNNFENVRGLIWLPWIIFSSSGLLLALQ